MDFKYDNAERYESMIKLFDELIAPDIRHDFDREVLKKNKKALQQEYLLFKLTQNQ